MLPIRDINPSKNYPVVNTVIISINVLIYFVEIMQGPGLDRFIFTYGLVPARYAVPHFDQYSTWMQQVIPLISFMFLHGSLWHLLGNMWTLYIFGDNMEDHLGPVRYLVFYLSSGLVSGASHFLLNPHSMTPTIGASGAIAGVMGAYMVLFPRARILTLIPIIIIPWFVELPAYVFLGFWFVMQFLNAAASYSGGGGIAWWAHVGGFAGGIILVRILEQMPASGVSGRLKQVTVKKTTPRLQVIPTSGYEGDPNLYGTITVTRHEAVHGAAKFITLRRGTFSKPYRLGIPAGMTAQKKLRLKGLGLVAADGSRGDLILEIVIVADGD